MTAQSRGPEEENPTPRTPRSVRVPLSGIQVRISTLVGDLVTISATGASVRTSRPLTVGSDLSLYLPDAAFPIHVRVMRATPVMVELPGATWLRKEYVVGVMFTHVQPKDQEVIAKLCGDAFGLTE